MKEGKCIAFFYNIVGELSFTHKKDNNNFTVDSNNFLHSFNDEPAYIRNPSKSYLVHKSLTWFNHGTKHRLFGSAFIQYNEDGTIYDKEYRIEGKELTQEQGETQTNRYKLLNEL